MSKRNRFITPAMRKAMDLLHEYRWVKLTPQIGHAMHARGLVVQSSRRNGFWRMTIEGEAHYRRLKNEEVD